MLRVLRLSAIPLLLDTPYLYVVVIALAEYVTMLVSPVFGMLAYSVLLIELPLHAARTADQPIHKLLLALILPVLIRLFSLAIPLSSYDLIYRYILIALPLFVAVRMIGRIDSWHERRSFKRSNLLLQLAIGLSGFVLGYVEYQILRPTPLIDTLILKDLWFPALILLTCTGLLEEVIFRGVMQSAAKAVLARHGIWYVALIFAIMHIGYRSVLDVVFVFFVGLYFGWMVHLTGSLLGVTLAHGITNILLFLIIPFSPWEANSLAGPVAQSTIPAIRPDAPVSAVLVQQHPSAQANEKDRPLIAAVSFNSSSEPLTDVLNDIGHNQHKKDHNHGGDRYIQKTVQRLQPREFGYADDFFLGEQDKQRADDDKT